MNTYAQTIRDFLDAMSGNGDADMIRAFIKRYL